MPNDELLIRPAVAADIPAITAIYRPAVETGTASFELSAPDENEMMKRMLAITAGGYPYLVAERGGDVVGYAYASAYRTRPGYCYSVEDSVYVRDDQRGRGTGRLLLGELVRLTVAAGYRQMIAVIGDTATPAPSTCTGRWVSRFAAPSTPSASSMAAGSTAS